MFTHSTHCSPVGQLIVSAAVIDDMIALVVLSFLETLTTEITAETILVPIISALSFLVIGGYIAINVTPGLIGRYILTRFEEKNHAKVELAIVIGLLLALMPATYYAQASYLMGSFLAGLVFCRSDGLHLLYASQFKRIIRWLMRLFFAGSIGFQVPVKNFGHGTVIWQGLMFTLAFTGKLGVGFMVPNFAQAKRFRGDHLRDCLITGCAMASEGEFALVIAVFSVDAGLTSTKLYPSIVLAILLSTIFPPFMLRFTIHYYRKKAKKDIQEAAEEVAAKDDDLLETIKKQSTLFLCIQTQSELRWGLMYDIMNAMYKLGLEVIDHRSWHPRGVHSKVFNEIYCKGSIDPALLTPGNTDMVVAEQMMKFRKELLEAINQPVS
jgi:Kef-type K+ transport system membrane component KefB